MDQKEKICCGFYYSADSIAVRKDCIAKGRRKVKMLGGPVLIDFERLEFWIVHLYIAPPPGSAGPALVSYSFAHAQHWGFSI